MRIAVCEPDSRREEVIEANTLVELTQRTKEAFGKGWSVVDTTGAIVTEAHFSAWRSSRQPITLTLMKRSQQHQISYPPHPHALTQSGRSHFTRISDALAELIDNSIQATDLNVGERDIRIQLELASNYQNSFFIVRDNGCGMDVATIEAFAQYYNGRVERNLRRNENYADEDSWMIAGDISKFGVGAKQAAFYLGRRLHLITRPRDTDDVFEFVLDREALDERHAAGQEVFTDTVERRDVCDNRLLQGVEAKSKALLDLVKDEANHSSFTALIIHMEDDKYQRIVRSGRGMEIGRELAHIYHYFLHPEDLPPLANSHDRYTRYCTHQDFSSSRFVERRHIQPCQINIEFQMSGSRTQQLVQPLSTMTSMEALYLDDKVARSSFRFEFRVPNPENVVVNQSSETGMSQLDELTSQTVASFKVTGVLYYYPYCKATDHRPTRAKLLQRQEKKSQYIDDDDEDVGDDAQSEERSLQEEEDEAIFECFWQRRLVPNSQVKRLPFFPLAKTINDFFKMGISSQYNKRLKGMLFFPWEFPITNNKLKLQASPNINEWINDDKLWKKHVKVEPRGDNLDARFVNWLKACHTHLDEEHVLSGRLASEEEDNPSESYFANVRIGREQFKRGDMVKLVKTKAKIFAQIVRFETEKLPTTVQEYNGAAKIAYRRQPEQLFGSHIEKTHLSMLDTSDYEVSNIELNKQLLKLPASICLWFDNLEWGDSDDMLDDDAPIKMRVNETVKFLRALIRDGRGKPVFVRRLGNKTVNYKTVFLVGDSEICATKDYFEIGSNKQKPVSSDGASSREKFACLTDFKITQVGMNVLTVRIFDDQHADMSHPHGKLVLEQHWDIQVIAEKATRFKVVRNHEAMIYPLECFFPSFEVVFTDDHGNPALPESEVTVDITAPNMKVECDGLESPQFNVEDEQGLYFENSWIATPTKPAFLSSTVIEEKKVVFALKVMEMPGVVEKFELIFSHGKLDNIKIISPAECVVENKSLVDITLACFDANGNRAAPEKGGKDKWVMRLEGTSPLKSAVKTVTVDSSGEAAFQQLQVNADSTGGRIPPEGLFFDQTFVLKAFKQDFKCPFTVKVLPSTLVSGCAILHNGQSLYGPILAVAGQQLHGLSMVFTDEAGEVVEIDKNSVRACEVSWAETLPDTEIQLLPPIPGDLLKTATALSASNLPNEGHKMFDVRLTLRDNSQLSAKFEVAVVHNIPVRWRLGQELGQGIRCGEQDDINKLIIVGEDEFENIVPAECLECSPHFEVDIIDTTDDATHTNTVTRTIPVIRGTRNVGQWSVEGYVVAEPRQGLLGQPQPLVFRIRDHKQTYRQKTINTILVAGCARNLSISSPMFDEVLDEVVDDSVQKVLRCPSFTNLRDLTVQVLDICGNLTSLEKLGEVQVRLGDHVMTKRALKPGKSQLTFVVPIKDFVSGSIVHVVVCDSAIKQAAFVCIKISTNRVVGLEMKLSNAAPKTVGEDVMLCVDSDVGFGSLEVRCITEDGNPYELNVDDVNLTMDFLAKSSEDRPAKKRKDEFFIIPAEKNGSSVVYNAHENAKLNLGTYTFTCNYKEKRKSFVDAYAKALLTQSNTLKVISLPGKPSKIFAVNPRCFSEGMLTAIGIAKSAEFIIADSRDNPVEAWTQMVCIIRKPDTSSVEILPQLNGVDENNQLVANDIGPERGVGTLRKYIFADIELIPETGSGQGELELVFSARDLEGVVPYVHTFIFTNDQSRRKSIADVTGHLLPVQRELRIHETNRGRVVDYIKRKKEQIRVSLRRVPSLTDLHHDPELDRLSRTRDDLLRQKEDMTLATSQVKKCVMPPIPAHIRQRKHIGVVAELGYVESEDLIRIMSYAARTFMDAMVVETTAEQVQFVKEFEMHTWAIDQMSVFKVPGSNRGRTDEEKQTQQLPLAPLPVKEGNPIHMVNLIKLSRENEWMRDCIFWSIYGRALLLNDLDSAMRFRAEMLRRKERIPQIYTRDGQFVPPAGNINPKVRLQKTSELRYMYGLAPPHQTSEFAQVERDISTLEKVLHYVRSLNRAQAALREMPDLGPLRETVKNFKGQLEQLGMLKDTHLTQTQDHNELEDNRFKDDFSSDEEVTNGNQGRGHTPMSVYREDVGDAAEDDTQFRRHRRQGETDPRAGKKQRTSLATSDDGYANNHDSKRMRFGR